MRSLPFAALVALLVLGLGGCTIEPQTIDEIEPNDGFAAAQEIPTDGTVLNGSLSTSDTEDIFRIAVTAGSSYQIQLTWVSGANLDLAIDWYDQDLNWINYIDSNLTQLNEAGTLTAETTGTCYLLVTDANMSGGEYQLSVTRD